MRRVLLVLAVICGAGWSQPAQQQAQVPIPIRIEMPPESVAMVLLKAVLPTVLGVALGSGISLYSIKQNNKHDLEKLNSEHAFAMKRDVLVHVTQSLVHTLAAVKIWDNSRRYSDGMRRDSESAIKQATEDLTLKWSEFEIRRTELEQSTAAAGLAVSDELWKLAQATGASIQKALEQREQPNAFTCADEQIASFVQAAQKELGIVHIDA
jgi:hypothetical protein